MPQDILPYLTKVSDVGNTFYFLIPELFMLLSPIRSTKLLVKKTTEPLIPPEPRILLLFSGLDNVCNEDLDIVYFIFRDVVSSSLFCGFLQALFVQGMGGKHERGDIPFVGNFE
jgi:hypothetical protein